MLHAYRSDAQMQKGWKTFYWWYRNVFNFEALKIDTKPKFNSSSSIGCKLFWDVTWPWPINLTPKWTLWRKSRFLLYSVDLWENRSRYRNNFNGLVLGNRVWTFQRHQNEPPSSLLPPHLGSKTLKQHVQSYFPLSNDNTLLQSCSHQKLPAAMLFV